VLLGIEFVTDRETPANAGVGKIASLCLEHGLIFQLRGTQGNPNVIRLVPPMIATDAEVDRAMSIMRDAIAVVSVAARHLAGRRIGWRRYMLGTTQAGHHTVSTALKRDRFGNCSIPRSATREVG
jgi:hypothetical protein